MIEAANAAKRGSSPGKDGITAEFYIRYWDLIGPVLHKALLWVVQQEDMGPEMTSALVYLLLKKGRDRLDPGSWRPLSLLGCDYKIFARVLARPTTQPAYAAAVQLLANCVCQISEHYGDDVAYARCDPAGQG